jgi:hypothetical protein
MIRSAPDLTELRRHAEEARDGATIGGIQAPPHTFVTVHWEVMLAVLDATSQPRVDAAHLTLLAAGTAAELNHAIAHNHERSEILRLLGQLMRQLHGLTERTTP